MELRKIQAFAGAVLIMGGLSMVSPVAAAGGSGGNCGQLWCWNSCADVDEFCGDEEVGCPSGGWICEVEDCLGVDSVYYDYSFTCGEET